MRRIGALAAPALHVASDPVLLEPADVAERPERRVELRGERRRQIGRQRERRAVGRRLERGRPAQGVVARVDQGEREQLLAGRAQARAVEARTRRTRSRRRRGGRAGAAVERQEARRHVGLVEAPHRHLVRRLGVAADPGDRNDARVLDHAGTQAQHLALDRDVGAVAEGDLDRARLDRDRADVFVDDLVGDRQARRRRCRPAACRSPTTRRRPSA